MKNDAKDNDYPQECKGRDLPRPGRIHDMRVDVNSTIDLFEIQVQVHDRYSGSLKIVPGIPRIKIAYSIAFVDAMGKVPKMILWAVIGFKAIVVVVVCVILVVGAASLVPSQSRWFPFLVAPLVNVAVPNSGQKMRCPWSLSHIPCLY